MPCQVYWSHAVAVAVPVVLWLMVKCRVVTLSHPAALVEVWVGMDVLAV